MKLLTAVLLTLTASSALAQEVPLHRFRDKGVLLAATALSGGPSFTIANPGAGYAIAKLSVVRTRNAGTDMTMTCTHTNDGGTTNAKAQTCEYTAASGTCTHYDTTWKSATSSTETLAWEVDVLGWISTTCTFASTSADTDTVKVLGALVTQ